MSYKIIGDSCTDLTKEMREDGHIQIVPLTLTVGTEDIVDDESFDQAGFLKKMKECSECPKSACPSPEAYMDAERESITSIFLFGCFSRYSIFASSAAL